MFTLSIARYDLPIVALLIAISNSAIGADNSTFKTVGAFVESLQPTRPVSGDLIAGFSGMGKGSIEPPQVEAWIPIHWQSQEICAMVRSRDGRYEAYQTYLAPENWPLSTEPDNKTNDTGIYTTFNFSNAKEIEFLSKYEKQLTVLVQLGKCGSDPTESSLSYWGGAAPNAKKNVILHLNTRRAQEASVYFIDGNIETQCEGITAGDRQVFDFTCTLDMELIGQHGNQMIEINRITRGNYDDPEQYTLNIPKAVR